MSKFVDNLVRQAEENPMLALGLGAGAVTALSKLLNAGTARSNSKTWQKEVNRRTKKSR